MTTTMTTTTRITTRTTTKTRTTTTSRTTTRTGGSQLWNMIETWGFWEDIKDTNIKENNYNNDDDNKDDNNNNKGISAQGFDRTLKFSRRQLLSFYF